MKVAIDGTTMRARDGGPGAGIEQYTREISAALVDLGGETVQVVMPIGHVPILSRHLSVPLQALMLGADVLFCPSGHIPLGWFGRAVIVVHDLAIHEHPEWFPSGPSFLDTRSIHRAEKIIAISEATKEQILRLFPDVHADITVIYPGTILTHMHQDGSTVAESPVESTGQREVVQDFVLFVGTLEPRKNLENAIAAFDRFLRMDPERAVTTRFVLAGKLGWKSESIVEAVTQTNDAWRKKAGEDVVHMLGYVNDTEKESLYAQAACLLFPSWYEGFGLPVLEAMAAGMPVITSNRGALPEVGGDAVMYVEPDDIEQMALALAQCVMMPEAMAEMVEAAKKRVNQFTWERCAKESLAIILSGDRQ